MNSSSSAPYTIAPTPRVGSDLAVYAGGMNKKSGNRYGDGREALLRAAVEVVADKGLRGMTFRAVADNAGVNNALIAHHFGNREGLLKAALEWSAEVSIKATDLPAATAHFSSFEKSLGLTATTQRKLLTFQYEMIIEASRNEQFREPVTKLYRAYFAALMPQEATKTNALTRAKFATLDGLVLQMVAGAISQDEFHEAIHAAAEWLSQPD